uniref:Uncharacterized LOC109995221 n=1 Tax=Labrus bergylta TaxID=56723 RepID=A0A3Q3EEN1_9LABR
ISSVVLTTHLVFKFFSQDTRLMIQLRATNEAIFTGRRNSAMRGWKAIRREMGLHGVMSARQMKKKWDNLKEKYRNPPEGMETQTQPNSWRWFQLMDEAMTGPTPPLILPNMATPDVEDLEQGDGSQVRIPVCKPQTQPAVNSSQTATVEVDRKLAELQKERQALEREQADLDRERAALERDRAAVERDRAAVERDRVFLDRDRAFVDRDRAFVERDRVLVERAQEDLERERAVWRREREGEAENGHPAEMASEKERLVSLFQRLVEKL